MTKEGVASLIASRAKFAAIPKSKGGTGGSAPPSKPIQYFYNPKTGRTTYQVGGGTPSGTGWQPISKPSGYVGGQTRGVAADVDKARAATAQQDVEALKATTSAKEKQIMILEYGLQQGMLSQKAAEKARAAQQELMKNMPEKKPVKTAFVVGGKTFVGTYGLKKVYAKPKPKEKGPAIYTGIPTVKKEDKPTIPKREPSFQESKVPSGPQFVSAGIGYKFIGDIQKDVKGKIAKQELFAPVAVAGLGESYVPEGTFRGSYKFDVTNLKPFDIEDHKTLDLTMDISKVAEYRKQKVTWENIGEIESALSESNLLTQKALLRGQTLSKQQAFDIRIGEEVSFKVQQFHSKGQAKIAATAGLTFVGVGAAGQVLGSLSKIGTVGKIIKVGSPLLKRVWGVSLASKGAQQIEFISEGQATRGTYGLLGLGAEVVGVYSAGKWLTATKGKPITDLYKKAKAPFFERSTARWQESLTDKSLTYKERMGFLALEGRPQRTLAGKPISPTRIKTLRAGVHEGFYNIDVVGTRLISTGFAKTKGYSNVDFLATQHHITSDYNIKYKLEVFKSGKKIITKKVPYVSSITQKTDPTRGIDMKAIDWFQPDKTIIITPDKMISYKGGPGYSQYLDTKGRFSFVQDYKVTPTLGEKVAATQIPYWTDTTQIILKTEPKVDTFMKPFTFGKTPKPKPIKDSKGIKHIVTTSGKHKTFISYKTDRTSLDRAARYDAAERDIQREIATQQAWFGKEYSPPDTRTVYVQAPSMEGITKTKIDYGPIATTTAGIKTFLDIEPIVDTRQIQDTRQILDLKQIQDTKQIVKQQQILEPKTKLILDVKPVLDIQPITKLVTITKTDLIQKTRQKTDLALLTDTVVVQETKITPELKVGIPIIDIIKEPEQKIPPFAFGFGKLPSMPQTRKIRGIPKPRARPRPKRREVTIDPFAGLYDVHVSEFAFGRATHPARTKEEKKKFKKRIMGGSQFFPTVELEKFRLGKLKL